MSDDATTIEEAVEIGLSAGYRHFDTTSHNDKTIGRVINEWIQKGKIKRQELFVVSKVRMTFEQSVVNIECKNCVLIKMENCSCL